MLFSKKQEGQQEDAKSQEGFNSQLKALQDQLAEQRKQIDLLVADKEALAKDAEHNAKALADERAKNSVAEAVRAGQLMPSQVADGSPWVQLAYAQPEIFKALVETMGKADMPTHAKLSAEGKKAEVESQVEKFKRLVAEGVDPDQAFREVQ